MQVIQYSDTWAIEQEHGRGIFWNAQILVIERSNKCGEHHEEKMHPFLTHLVHVSASASTSEAKGSSPEKHNDAHWLVCACV